MNQKTFFIIAGILFLIVGSVHIIRAFLSWTILIHNWYMPVWFSYVAGIFILFLSYSAFRFAKEADKTSVRKSTRKRR